MSKAALERLFFRAANRQAAHPPGPRGKSAAPKSQFGKPNHCVSAFKAAHENISLFENPDSPVCQPRPASLSQGPLAIVTDVGSGMRWTALMSQTNGLDADGEDALSHRKLPAARAARETMRN